jgi:hypothetical protein
VVGVEDIVDFTAKEDPFERLAKRFGAAVSKTFARISGFSEGIQLR